MKSLRLFLVACILFVFTPVLQAQSFFPSAVVSSILSQANCAGLRVYPTYDDQVGVSCMIIGIDAGGNEIVKGASYQLSTGIIEGVPRTSGLDASAAKTECSAYNAQHSAYLSDFSSGTISGYLAEGSSGLCLTRAGNNFTARSYSSSSGIQPTGEPVPGNPCPTACGEPQQYLCSPN